MLLDRYTNSVLRYRWPVLAIATLIMLATGVGALSISVTNNYRIMFSEDNPQYAAFKALENTFSTSDNALIAIAPKGGSVFTREALAALEELTRAAWKTPHSSRVDSLTNYNHSRAEGDDLIVEPLVEDASALGKGDLARIRKIALESADLSGRLVSRDGRVGGLAITFVLPDKMDAAVRKINDYLNATLKKARAKHPDIGYYMSGDVIINRAFTEATLDDFFTLGPIVFLIIIVTTTLLLRSFLGMASIVVVIGFVVATTMGIAGWFATVFNPANASVPTIVMATCVAHSVHIITTTLLGMGHGLEKDAAISESLRSNAWPVFLTSLTTAIGFLSLNYSDSPPFRALGNLVAFGVGCAFIYSMTLLPALLSLLPLRARRIPSDKSLFFERLGAFVVKRRVFLLMFVSILAALLISGIPRNELTERWAHNFDERYQYRRDTDFISRNMTGMIFLEYALKSGREGGITKPEYLRKVEAFAEWCRKQTEVTHVQAFSDIMKRLNKNMHGDDPAFYRLPGDPELAAQYLLLYEFSLPFGMDLNNRIDVAKSTTRMTVVLNSLSSRDQRDFDERAQAWLRANIPEFAAEASGIAMIFAHLSLRNIHGMLRGTILAMLLISFLLILVFKSVRLGLISLVPNFIPAAMTFGLWGYLIGQVGLAGSVMTAIAFGIIVDDTIHFMSRYLKARRMGLSAPEAVRASFRIVGQALWTTTAVLTLGFLVFATSGFEASRALGVMVAITLVFALLTDFLLLPTLLMALDRKK
ncbi:MAG: MMPL family transporter [Nitrospinae bacterium]|nr:MMPL family transporter [Nitrospinota bacterium]